MMFEMMNDNPFLVIVGMVYIMVGVSYFSVPKIWEEFVDLFAHNNIIILVYGMIVFTFGVTILTLQYSWDGIAEGLLTIIGLIGVLEGTAMLVRPRMLQALVITVFYRKLLSLSGAFAIAVGLALLFL
ncbi:MAG: hypothetical protein QF692_04725 [Alphaproteobacteria bacterium]|jgi:uncharacterized protein YjeT (DUF2065 family)|nr:hypothetical protein [Alphaproteobacteria bacterium]MDP7222553.1 hypothetical protein [Alphaproteobacteria bacterium]